MLTRDRLHRLMPMLHEYSMALLRYILLRADWMVYTMVLVCLASIQWLNATVQSDITECMNDLEFKDKVFQNVCHDLRVRLTTACTPAISSDCCSITKHLFLQSQAHHKALSALFLLPLVTESTPLHRWLGRGPHCCAQAHADEHRKSSGYPVSCPARPVHWHWH